MLKTFRILFAVILLILAVCSLFFNIPNLILYVQIVLGLSFLTYGIFEIKEKGTENGFFYLISGTVILLGTIFLKFS